MPTVWVGQGTTLSIATVGIVQVTEISGPEIGTGAKGKTNLSDVAIRMRPQLPSGGTVSLTIQYDPVSTVHQGLTTLAVAWPQPISACVLTFPTTGTSTWTFNAFITKFAPKGMNEEDNLEADLELTIDGVPTVAHS